MVKGARFSPGARPEAPRGYCVPGIFSPVPRVAAVAAAVHASQTTAGPLAASARANVTRSVSAGGLTNAPCR